MKTGSLSLLTTILAIMGMIVLPGRAFSQESAFGDLVPDTTLTTTSVESLQLKLSVGGPRALIYNDYDYPNLPVSENIKAALVGTGQFGPADIDILPMVWYGYPPSLETFSEYDCIYVQTAYMETYPVLHGDRLKEYVDSGGGVILLAFSFSPTESPWRMQGGIMEPGYSPFVSTPDYLPNIFPRVLDFTTALTSHPMLAGVTEFTYQGNHNYGVVTLDPGAVLVGSDTLGAPVLAINNAGDVTAINAYLGHSLWPQSAGVYKTLANACTAASAMRVDIDIKPGSDPNSINLASGGVVPIAIFGSDRLDVTWIDTSTLSMADAGVKVVGKKNKELCGIEDVDGDGFDDLVCKFNTIDLGALDGTSSEATVKGTLNNGRAFEGKDTVNIVKE